MTNNACEPSAEDLERLVAQVNGIAGVTYAQWVDRCASTNTMLLTDSRFATPSPGFALLGTVEQTAGRGRGGRAWTTLPGSSLMFSIGMHWNRGLNALSGLSIAVGIGLANAFEPHITAYAQSPASIRIKWPNDLWLYSSHSMALGKLGGILIETVPIPADNGTGHWVVIGCGVNLHNAQRLTHETGRAIASLDGLTGAQAFTYTQAAMTAARGVIEAVRDFCQNGLNACIPLFNARDALHGLTVEVEHQGRTVSGQAQGCDGLGHLLVRIDGVTIPIIAGQVQTQLHKALLDEPASS